MLSVTFCVPSPAALCRYLPRRERNFLFLLGSNSFFEPEGRGFESLPAYHFKINTLGGLLRDFSQVGFPSIERWTLLHFDLTP